MKTNPRMPNNAEEVTVIFHKKMKEHTLQRAPSTRSTQSVIYG